jgi:hypothetical protein
VRVVGLTSPGNLEFTRSLGCYDEVLSYDALTTLAASEPSIYVDFAGDGNVRRAVHEHFGAALTYSCTVGGTHWQDRGSFAGLPGPQPVLFFAPTQARLRSAPPPDGWGGDGLAQRIGAAWMAFMQPVSESASPWLRVISARGADAVRETYLRLLDGRGEPRDGYMLAL